LMCIRALAFRGAVKQAAPVQNPRVVLVLQS